MRGLTAFLRRAGCAGEFAPACCGGVRPSVLWGESPPRGGGFGVAAAGSSPASEAVRTAPVHPPSASAAALRLKSRSLLTRLSPKLISAGRKGALVQGHLGQAPAFALANASKRLVAALPSPPPKFRLWPLVPFLCYSLWTKCLRVSVSRWSDLSRNPARFPAPVATAGRQNLGGHCPWAFSGGPSPWLCTDARPTYTPPQHTHTLCFRYP